MHLFLDRMREIYATTDTITSLQGYAAKQGVLGQQRQQRRHETMFPRTPV